ncbi:MAG TPA: hypothetical protein VGP70_11050 [Actinomadura sp.]|nr:hypothetical protein [Actinomadura sp.]
MDGIRTLKKLLPLALVAAGSSLGITGCGTVQATGQATGEAQARAGSAEAGAPPIDAALVTPAFGWVLTADRLLLTRDGGATFTDAMPPVPQSRTRAAFFRDDRNGYVTASTGNAIATARTSDGGRTWRIRTALDASAPTAYYGRLRMSFGDASHGVVLAQTSTSAMSSEATLFATEDGGNSWSARTAPAAGEVTVEPGGRTWLAGGTADDELHASSDAGRHWSRTKLHVNGAVETKAVSPPVDGVLPVTVVTTSDTTEVALLTTSDRGHTWREAKRVPVHGRTGPGVRVPVVSGESGPLVLDTAGGHAYRVAGRRDAMAGSRVADIRPSGLPEGGHTVTLATGRRSGWALATYGRCTDGKTGCTLYNPLMATTDGGATWHRLRLWQERLN